eukprot:TRINITY_DN29945_c0_g1_i1.p1 TRINITY_DN29945_c0_g1~~TRINITY_DN29945_c0_g1_i1.p1  ORF type:complete len:197 (-),score=71.61 TRINITY_DN29945_c0_g1_i1:178-768(-)
MISLKTFSSTTFLLVLLTFQTSTGQDITCDDCIMLVDGLMDVLLTNESIIAEQGAITNSICPGAGLGDEEAHPNCEKFTAHHWVDLATALFPQFIAGDSLCSDSLGWCSQQIKEEVSCESCMAVTQQVGEMLGEEEAIAQMVAFLQSDFCVNGVPEDDKQFCMDYTSIVLPSALPMFSSGIIEKKEDICTTYFNTC